MNPKILSVRVLLLAGLIGLGYHASECSYYASCGANMGPTGLKPLTALVSSLEKVLGSVAYAQDRYTSLINEGTAKQREGDYSQATEIFRKAIEVDRQSPVGYVNACTAYSMWAETLQRSDPRKAKEFFGLSNQYGQQALGNLTPGRKGFRLDAINQMTSIVYETLASNSKMNGDNAEAIRWLEMSLKHSPSEMVKGELESLRGGKP